MMGAGKTSSCAKWKENWKLDAVYWHKTKIPVDSEKVNHLLVLSRLKAEQNPQAFNFYTLFLNSEGPSEGQNMQAVEISLLQNPIGLQMWLSLVKHTLPPPLTLQHAPT